MSINLMRELLRAGATGMSRREMTLALADHDAVVAERDAALKRVAELEQSMRLIEMQDVDKSGQYTAFATFAQEIARNAIGGKAKS